MFTAVLDEEQSRLCVVGANRKLDLCPLGAARLAVCLHPHTSYVTSYEVATLTICSADAEVPVAVAVVRISEAAVLVNVWFYNDRITHGKIPFLIIILLVDGE